MPIRKGKQKWLSNKKPYIPFSREHMLLDFVEQIFPIQNKTPKISSFWKWVYEISARGMFFATFRMFLGRHYVAVMHSELQNNISKTSIMKGWQPRFDRERLNCIQLTITKILRHFTYEKHMELEHLHTGNFHFTYEIEIFSRMKYLIHMWNNWD